MGELVCLPTIAPLGNRDRMELILQMLDAGLISGAVSEGVKKNISIAFLLGAAAGAGAAGNTALRDLLSACAESKQLQPVKSNAG